MTEKLEQRYCIKFCVKLGDSQVEMICKIQQAFVEEAMGTTQIKEWYNHFKDGRTSVEIEAHSGSPSTSRNAIIIDQLKTLVMQDRRIMIRELADEMDVSTGSIHSIMQEDLGLRISAKFLQKLLTIEQKQLCLEIAQDMLETVNSDPNFNTVITGDESWVFGYDPETKLQSSQWKHPTSPRPKKARQIRSNVRVMLTVFFDSSGMVHHKYAPRGTTITNEYYQEVLHHL
ncbi:protein GVQW3-like [Babylonia areolata]|uniref:protein GVQW3-like n=1 Tax=Babylonia areolata TaxID=304850 RepID=UPI003FD2D5D3